MLSDEELAEIRARADAASPAPWQVARGWDGEPYAAVEANGGLRTSIASMLRPGVTPGGGFREPEERPLKNAEFIAHAREDVPTLLNEVAELRAQREAVLALHFRREVNNLLTVCDACPAEAWPCATVRAMGVTE